jgi:membrane protease YdiL (CAAX protease family)
MDHELITATEAENISLLTLGEALLIGITGLSVFMGMLAALIFVWTPSFGLPRPEVRAIDISLECLAVGISGYLTILVLSKGRVRGFWSGIQWNASTIPMSAFALLGLLGSLVLRAVRTGEFIPSQMLGLHMSWRMLVVILLSSCLLEPLLEEIYFRGILFVGLTSRLDAAKSIFIVTVIFDVLHAQHAFIVLPFAIAVAIVRVWTRSTANCVALHAAYNLGVILWGVS